MCGDRKQHIVDASVEFIDMKLSPLCSVAGREFWRQLIADTVMAALVAYDGELANAPRLLRLFCPSCLGWIRAKEKHAGREMACPLCGDLVRIETGRN